jgi:hypothetical protein
MHRLYSGQLPIFSSTKVVYFVLSETKKLKFPKQASSILSGMSFPGMLNYFNPV